MHKILIYVLVVLIILVLICALLASGRSRHLPFLTSDARDEFFRYIASRPDARKYEEQRSGIRDITRNPEEFFASELRELEHSDVTQMVKANGGLITVEPVRRWIAENSREMDVWNRS